MGLTIQVKECICDLLRRVTDLEVTGPMGPVAANPTASVGLVPVNGAAVTYMRSDAAPPIDAAMNPTWTGKHRFNQPVRLPVYTVATLPAGQLGDIALVSDATAPTYLGALVGGGAVTCPVYYNGAAWISH